ncbi:MAG TPA: thrombospondin type 3 repeat-containing protein [Chitinispirillaceae bacterium]|nr:thrombospondin type 3 repeat-containing protein [Chitinispirillaceae bacterium]
MSTGDHIIPIAQRGGTLADGVYLVRFSTGTQKLMFRYIHHRNLTGFGAVSSKTSQSAISDTVNIAKIQLAGAVDTLVISKIVNEIVSTRKVLIFNYNDNINSYIPDGKQILIIDPSNDNDGDGIADRQEILDGTNPLIADVPSYSFRIKSYPVLIANFSKSIGGSKERAISSGGEYSKTSTFTTAQELNWNAEIALMLGFAQEYKKDGGFTLNGSVTATLGVGGSISFSQEKSESMSKNWSEALTLAETYEATFEGGTIAIDVEFENTSGQDITLVNPMIRLSKNGTLSTTLETLIGELTLEDDLVYGKRILISSAVGNNKTTRTFKASVSNPEVFDMISQISTGLSARLENIRFETSVGGIDTLMSNVYRRNAQVIIDAGYYSTKGTTISR